MGARPVRSVGEETPEETSVGAAVDVATILDNVVALDRMLDEGSRRELAELPYLELSKHLKIKQS